MAGLVTVTMRVNRKKYIASSAHATDTDANRVAITFGIPQAQALQMP